MVSVLNIIGRISWFRMMVIVSFFLWMLVCVRCCCMLVSWLFWSICSELRNLWMWLVVVFLCIRLVCLCELEVMRLVLSLFWCLLRDFRCLVIGL